MFLTETLDFIFFFVVHTFLTRKICPSFSGDFFFIFFLNFDVFIFKSLPASRGWQFYPKDFLLLLISCPKKVYFSFYFDVFSKREFLYIHCSDFQKDVALKEWQFKEPKIKFMMPKVSLLYVSERGILMLS